MFGLFGFDPSSMSDEELLQKSVSLSERLVWANRFGGAEMISRLQDFLSQIEFERQERVLRFIANERNNMFPNIIESDPDLAENGKLKEPVKGKVVQQQRLRPLITRTSKPTDETTQYDDSSEKKKDD